MKIFLDSSVLVSSLYSSKGASAHILTLCEKGVIDCFITHELYKEVLKVIKTKMPQILNDFDRAVKSVLTVKRLSSFSLSEKAKSWIKDQNDVKVLVGAKLLEVDYLITLDIKDFLKDKNVAKKSGLKILTPADFLDMYYKRNCEL